MSRLLRTKQGSLSDRTTSLRGRPWTGVLPHVQVIRPGHNLRKKQKMKLLLHSFSSLVISALTLALTPAFALGNDTARGGAADLIGANPPPTAKQVSAPMVKHAGSCAQCRTTWSSVTVQESKNKIAQTLPVERHNCGDCKTTVSTQGHGKSKQDVVAHVCQNAGGQSMAGCCVK